MTISQYKALEAHIAFWGSVIVANVVRDPWVSAAFIVIAVVQMVRQLYWYTQMVKEKQ